MSGSLNKVQLIGNLAADPEVRFAGEGNAVCNLRVATNEEWKDKKGVKQKKTEFHRVTVWGKLAELCGEYLKKGRQVYLEGRLETRSYDDKKTGEKKYSTDIVANSVVFLGGGRSAADEPGDADDSF